MKKWEYSLDEGSAKMRVGQRMEEPRTEATRVCSMSMV